MTLRSKTNGELLHQALSALEELVRRGNRQLDGARQQVEFQRKDYFLLKSQASAMEASEERARFQDLDDD